MQSVSKICPRCSSVYIFDSVRRSFFLATPLFKLILLDWPLCSWAETRRPPPLKSNTRSSERELFCCGSKITGLSSFIICISIPVLMYCENNFISNSQLNWGLGAHQCTIRLCLEIEQVTCCGHCCCSVTRSHRPSQGINLRPEGGSFLLKRNDSAKTELTRSLGYSFFASCAEALGQKTRGGRRR